MGVMGGGSSTMSIPGSIDKTTGVEISLSLVLDRSKDEVEACARGDNAQENLATRWRHAASSDILDDRASMAWMLALAARWCRLHTLSWWAVAMSSARVGEIECLTGRVALVLAEGGWKKSARADGEGT